MLPRGSRGAHEMNDTSRVDTSITCTRIASLYPYFVRGCVASAAQRDHRAAGELSRHAAQRHCGAARRTRRCRVTSSRGAARSRRYGESRGRGRRYLAILVALEREARRERDEAVVVEHRGHRRALRRRTATPARSARTARANRAARAARLRARPFPARAARRLVRARRASQAAVRRSGCPVRARW